MIKRENIEVEFEENEMFLVYADEFYIEQVFTNYITNAIKYSEMINGVRKIIIKNEKIENKLRITVFNSSKGLSEENLMRIWNRFYKEDKSRTRLKGGTGIGLAVVKAIMTKYKREYGVINKTDGVEFYFDIDTK